MKTQHIGKFIGVMGALVLAFSLFCIGGYAYAADNAHGSTSLTLRAIDNPFQVGEDQNLTLNEGDDATLTGEIEGGIGNVGYQWSVSTDGGKTWTDIAGATDSSYRIVDAQPGDYIYRLTAMDQYGNSAYQDFYVHVDAAPVVAGDSGDGTGNVLSDVLGSLAPKTGDNILMLCAVCIAGAAALAAICAVIVRKRMSTQESDGDLDE